MTQTYHPQLLVLTLSTGRVLECLFSDPQKLAAALESLKRALTRNGGELRWFSSEEELHIVTSHIVSWAIRFASPTDLVARMWGELTVSS